MKYVLETLRLEEERQKLPVIRMEIDYELLTLYDALQDNDTVLIIKTKERLEHLRKQLIKLEKD
ncbi:hypothetical protein GMD78_14505 [Ornithinibacillus sp. L9]|uniref:Uncharacterized protein n=1 Tax=Ornithinibacillus caprae TaxID=2678566 RepID=A0A6N8FLH4_9BACI|nr:hypothetical protein [Ornithinibacillus caprae]MUK89576.1 hypothetical protein [Ornithinibacillus caprae]